MHSRRRKSQEQGARRIRAAVGVRTAWHTVADGEFFCPDCGGDRNYRRCTGRRRFTVLGIPLLPRGVAGPVVECADCRGHFGTDSLDHPTSTRLSVMLRDAVHTVALAVLATGGAQTEPVRDAALGAVRDAGYEDCTEEQLLALVAALEADTGRLPEMFDSSGSTSGGAPSLEIELHEALEPLAPHLAPAGRERVLLVGARIALADGPYSPVEREVLTTIGSALLLCADDTARLLAAARTPS
ncbi:TerB family tellurite resistance protein [Streptomyces sp. A7024]|uniref:TerB family tellurite resistance protein n=1 Tax=Streptomyces coryli TaxID=1128680 RepID=A0A6G4UCW3_9ACTN|nr:TerB family tellurite resistance protein [Streptomyces coryli]NGN69041.1 TerB family tellurite resistance protein [Streptomyces coryli]